MIDILARARYKIISMYKVTVHFAATPDETSKVLAAT
jgi:hypothetical protein